MKLGNKMIVRKTRDASSFKRSVYNKGYLQDAINFNLMGEEPLQKSSLRRHEILRTSFVFLFYGACIVPYFGLYFVVFQSSEFIKSFIVFNNRLLKTTQVNMAGDQLNESSLSFNQ